MEGIPISGLDELNKHIQKLLESPDTPLQPKLFDDVELQLNETNTPLLIPHLLSPLTHLLLTTPHQNPTPIVTLTTKLIQPLPFTTLLHLATEPSLLLALTSATPSPQLLALNILSKAAATSSEAAILANIPTLITALVTTWLSTPNVSVGASATKCLLALLTTDCAFPPPSPETLALNARMRGLDLSDAQLDQKPRIPGQGLLWRRLFTDRAIYTLILTLCSPSHTPLSEHQLSLAQSRFLELLPPLSALDFSRLTRTDFPDVDRTISGGGMAGTGVKQGILWFAALEMVDATDVVMSMVKAEFLRELFQEAGPEELRSWWGAMVKEVFEVGGGEELRRTLEELVGREGTEERVRRLLGSIDEGER